MAASLLSPVSIAVLMPNDFNSLSACAAPDRHVSERENIPIGTLSKNMYPKLTPSLPSMFGTEKMETDVSELEVLYTSH